MLRLTIDGREVLAEPGALLAVLLRAGAEVPHLCDDPRIAPSGACRMCVVELEGAPRPVASCTTPALDGMRVRTRSEALEAHRRTLLELLASSYPPDAPEAAPEKPLHRLLRRYGVEPSGGRRGELRDDSHPYLHVDLSQCIHCYRCVRICDELQGQFTWRITGRGAETRVIPDSFTTMFESSCVACGACADTCPSGAIDDRAVVALGAPDRWTRTTCSYCGVGCEVELGTREERIVTARPASGPSNKGHLCSKGRYAYAFVESSERLTTPLLRTSTGWRELGWDEAVREVAGRLERIRDAHGPDSLGVLGSARATNEENYVTQKFARVALGTHNVDCCARVCHAPSAAALGAVLGAGAATSSFDDIELARTILAVGTNTTENHPVVGARLKQAALRGANLVVIDPRRTELAAYATVHLQPRPGTDVALLNAMAQVIVSEGLVDPAYLARRVDGFAQFQAFIAEWTPERAETICGVPSAQLRRAAALYAGERPSISFHGLGVTEHVQGTDGVMALVNLALLTGNLGLPGTGVNPLRGQNNVQGAAHMGCEPKRLTGYVPIEQERARFEQAWQAPLPTTPGLDLMEMLAAASAGRMKGLWVIGYDVLQTNPQMRRTRASLAALELLIVQDIFLNELGRELATVALPASSALEKEGTFMNSERRVQRVRAAVPPRGESRTDWRILCDVARALGQGERFAWRSAEEIWDEVRAVWPAGAGMSWRRLDAGGLQWPCPAEDHPGTARLHTDGFPIGPRATLRCVAHVDAEERTDAQFPLVLITGRSLYQFGAGTMTMRTPNVLLRPRDLLQLSPEDAYACGVADGAYVKVRSRHGETVLEARIDPGVMPGQLFATFQTPVAKLNLLTGPLRDEVTHTPAYKVTAVRVEPVVTTHHHAQPHQPGS